MRLLTELGITILEIEVAIPASRNVLATEDAWEEDTCALRLRLGEW